MNISLVPLFTSMIVSRCATAIVGRPPRRRERFGRAAAAATAEMPGRNFRIGSTRSALASGQARNRKAGEFLDRLQLDVADDLLDAERRLVEPGVDQVVVVVQRGAGDAHQVVVTAA